MLVHFDIDRCFLPHQELQTSNRVCIYAPRFGAVRKVDIARSDNEFQGLHKLNLPMRPALAGEATLASTSEQPVGPINEVGTRPVLALVEKQTGIDLHNEQAVSPQSTTGSSHTRIFPTFARALSPPKTSRFLPSVCSRQSLGPASRRSKSRWKESGPRP